MATNTQYGVKLNIREMTEDDIPALSELDKKIVGKDRAVTYGDPIDFYLGGEFAVSFIAEADGKVVGFALGRIRDADTAWLQSVAIDPEYRHRKIGAKLVEAMVNSCRSKGVKTVHTVVSWRDWAMLSFLNSLEFTRSKMVDLKRTL